MAEPKIIFEDQDIIVLDKPAGITVNNSETTKGEQTVQDWIVAYELSKGNDMYRMYRKETSSDTSESPYDTFLSRAGIVHRLDKETSGILLVAKTEKAFVELQRQFKEREVEKEYVALVHGDIKVEEGEIVVPVGRLPWNRTQFGVIAGGREASTGYKVVAKYKNPLSKFQEMLTLLRLTPKTGRTHQIRVHLKYFNHPIFADFLYAGRKTSRADREQLPRVFLHAAKIKFGHPSTREEVSFESSLPPELENFLLSLKNG